MSFNLPGSSSCNKQSKSSEEMSFLNISFNDVSLFKKLSESSEENKNIFFSPMSISLSLSMLLLSSDGTTKQQLKDALWLTKDEQLFDNLKELNDILSSNSDGLQVQLANSVFPSKMFQMVAKYEKDLESAFKCLMVFLDYMSNAEELKTRIKDWVASCTIGKITDLFGDLDSNTVCALVSCIYFKGDWLYKFNPRSTRDAPFHCAENKTSTVKMMIQENCYSYMDFYENGFKCLRIPYKDRDFSMVVIKPFKRHGIEDVIDKLDEITVEKIKYGKNFKEVLISLKLPKFKIEYEANLYETLRYLKIKDAFDEKNADFSAISKDALRQDSRLHVSEIVHKAFVETNEEGTEAAAATGIRMCYESSAATGIRMCYERSVMPEFEPQNFTVDHPFLFMILYKNQILFMGKVTSL